MNPKQASGGKSGGDKPVTETASAGAKGGKKGARGGKKGRKPAGGTK